MLRRLDGARWLVVLLLGALTTTAECMCPTGCSCSSDGRRSVRCDGVPLGDVPSLLDPRTRTLSLSNCSLARLDPDLLELYPDLEFFDASSNSLENLDVGLFKFQSKLRVLLLSANKLTAIRRGNFAGLARLQLLDLSLNGIDYIDSSSLQDASSLVELKLSQNRIHALHPSTFQGLYHLRRLDLSSNLVVRLDADVLRPLKTLEWLDLSRNLLNVVMPLAFTSQGSLKNLNLGANSLVSLGETSLQGLKALRYLNLSNNLFRQLLSLAFRPLTSLRELDLSWNVFSEVPTSSFDGLTSLQHLDITHERFLQKIYVNAFSGLPNLRHLNVSSCSQLESIDENAFENAHRLKVLDFSDCKFRRIPPTLLDWDGLEVLEISGNPMHCDCELQSFLPSVVRSLHSDVAFCATPPHLESIAVADLPSSCTQWSESELSVLLVVALLAVATLILLTTLCVCSRRRRTRTPVYERSLLTAFSATYDKSDLLSDHTTLYSATSSQRSEDILKRAAAIADGVDYYGGCDESTYSTVGLPDPDETGGYPPPPLYEQPFGVRPKPPPETTIPCQRPRLLPPEGTPAIADLSSSADNFKIICEFPVPITEL